MNVVTTCASSLTAVRVTIRRGRHCRADHGTQRGAEEFAIGRGGQGVGHDGPLEMLGCRVGW